MVEPLKGKIADYGPITRLVVAAATYGAASTDNTDE